MFKKTLLVLVIAFAALFAASCGERTYKADGVYTAFSTELQSNKKPQVTLVSVTIEDDKITDFFIDCYQSDFNADTKKYAFKNPKKTLGYKYGMHNPKVAGVPTYDLTTEAGIEAYKAYLAQNNKLEWFEQANKITAFVLANGEAAFDDLVVKTDGYLDLDASDDAVAGVTVHANEYKEVLEGLYNNFKK